MKQTTDELIEELKKRTQFCIDSAINRFKPLTQNQVNWKPDPERWSIGECLEHLNLYGDYYIPTIQEAIKNGADTKPVDKFKSGWLGNYSANAMLPKDGAVTNNMKTLKDKNPAFSSLPKNVVDRFIDQQKEILKLLEKSQSVNLMKVRVSISIGKFIKFKLGDTFRFIIYHHIRHILQAEKVYEELLKTETTA